MARKRSTIFGQKSEIKKRSAFNYQSSNDPTSLLRLPQVVMKSETSEDLQELRQVPVPWKVQPTAKQKIATKMPKTPQPPPAVPKGAKGSGKGSGKGGEGIQDGKDGKDGKGGVKGGKGGEMPMEKLHGKATWKSYMEKVWCKF